MNFFVEGVSSLLDISMVLYVGVGLVLGFMVGAFPGITATMAVALAAGFTMTLEPVQGLAVLLTIYVAANFGDRVPSILINTPGTPASIATTLDGYPMAKQGRAGLALTISAIVSAVGILPSLVLFSVAAVPVASFARDYFRSPELFALVVFGIAIMIGISSKSMLKGILAGLFGLMLGTVGTYAATADQRFTFGVLGAVMVGWMITLGAIARGPLRRREPWAWWAVTGSVAAWFILDGGVSMYFGFVGNAMFNTAFAVAIAIPLIAIRRGWAAPE